MPDVKKILFPVDFSTSCFGAARHVEAMAGHFEAEIMLLHVVGMGEHNLAEDLLPGRKIALDGFLVNEFKYFTTHRVCVTGDASSVIADTARSWNPDLVMMPTHGLGYFSRHLLGSVTAKALHDLHCPVWTSVHEESAPSLENIHCRRVLCAIDTGECGANILGWAAWLAREYQASLGIVHATAALDISAGDPSFAEQYQQYTSERALKMVESLRTNHNVAAQLFIRPGSPDTVIADAAREFGADLIVIGRHGDGGFLGNLFENACSILRESPCPVVSI